MLAFRVRLTQKKKPLRGNGAASNDCLPYEKKLKAVSDRQAKPQKSS